MSKQLRVGVVGCGVIAQVMHLPHLRDLEQYELAAVCDVTLSHAEACAARFGAGAAFDDHVRMLRAADLDVVLDLTPNSHAPVALAAIEAGCHVFVEKPMCLNLDEARAMLEAVRAADVRLMVGTHKRYDPAYERLVELLDGTELRLVQSTTLESPQMPYTANYAPIPPRPLDPELAAELDRDHWERVEVALPGADRETLHAYRYMLLCNLVHELNMLRGALGEPDRVSYASVERRVVQLGLRFGETECHLSWVDLPGMSRYKQELSFYGLERRLTLTLPSPYLRDMPSQLAIEAGGEEGTVRSHRTVEVLSFEEAFKRELVELADAIAEQRDPRTNVIDGLHDVVLCNAIIQAHITGEPVEQPSELPDWALERVAVR